MTDFYTRLEEQLATAGRARAGRGQVRRLVAGRRPQLVAAVAVAAVVAIAVSVLPGVLSSPDRAPAGPVHAVPAPLIKRTVRLEGITVTVLNGTTTAGRARIVATALEERGAHIVEVKDALDQTMEHSEVRFQGNADPQARRVASVLGIARIGMVVNEPLATADVLVFVGADGVKLAPPGEGRRVPTPEQVATVAAQAHGLQGVTCTLTRGSFAWNCSGRKGARAWSCVGNLRRVSPRDLVVHCKREPRRR